MDSTMYHVITDTAFWVAVLGGVFGFISYEARKRAANTSVNRAVEAEVLRLKEVVERHLKFWTECADKHATLHHPLIPFSHPVFDKQVENVGVVKRERVAEVVRFYGYVDYINQFQATREIYIKDHRSDEFDQMYIRVLRRMAESFKGRP